MNCSLNTIQGSHVIFVSFRFFGEPSGLPITVRCVALLNTVLSLSTRGASMLITELRISKIDFSNSGTEVSCV